MLLIQIFLIVFFLFAISRVVGRWRARGLGTAGAVFWVALWVVAGLIAVRPNSTSYFAKALGIGRGADLVVYLALAGIFFILFRMMVRAEQQSRALTKLTRKLSLLEADKERKL